jgi:sugar/nucleoside kinase (ribokinase family)
VTVPAPGDKPRVIVVGDVVTDLLVRPVSRPVHGTDTPATIRSAGGGGGANTAAWLATAGMPVTLVARVGDDLAGRQRSAELAAFGVTCALAVDPQTPTGAIVVLVDTEGERTMLTDRGASALLSADDVEAGFAATLIATHLHLSGYTLLDADSRPAGTHALARARAAGLTISVDAASAAPLHAAGPAAFLRWIDGVDLLLANADEATALTGLTDPDAAAEELRASAAVVVIKRGRDGAVWRSAEARIAVPAEQTTVVDSTGAGDAFAAGLLAAWLGGADPASALQAGARLGARATSVLGAEPQSLPGGKDR